MSKKTKKSNVVADDDHLFSLRPRSNICKFNQLTSISFCDQGTKNKKHKHFSSCLQYPIFNKDKNFGSPSFILNSQKQYYEQKGVKIKQEHQRKMFEYTDQKNSLNIPKPRSKNSFCSVCRQVYEDYLEHVKSENHRRKINASVFNTYILEVEAKFNYNTKALSINYSQHNLNTRDQEEVEIIQNPSKKFKLDSENPIRHPYLQTPNNNYTDYFKQYYMDGQVRNSIIPPPHINYYPRYSYEMQGQQYYRRNFQVNQFVQNIPSYQPFNSNYSLNIFLNPYSSFMCPNPIVNPFLNDGSYYEVMPPPHICNRMMENGNLFIQNNSFLMQNSIPSINLASDQNGLNKLLGNKLANGSNDVLNNNKGFKKITHVDVD